MPLIRGNLYRYNYLWSREYQRQEESGRKARPVCVVVRSSVEPAVLFLFPVTSQPPPPDMVALAVSESECRYAGLNYPSWIVLEEYNSVQEDELFDFESLRPIGKFSRDFLGQVAVEIKKAATSKRLTGVPR